MHPVVYHIVSGQAFFTGTLMLIVSALASTKSTPMSRRVTVWAFLSGAGLASLSSTPLSWWGYVMAVGALLIWIEGYFKTERRGSAAAFMVTVLLIVMLAELPFHLRPTLQAARDRSITVVGDSVTAGVGGDETSRRWPELLASAHHLRVQDISNMGETAASALKRAKPHTITSSIVIVEIGGNDVLGGTTPEEFTADLSNLLVHLSTPHRQVVMFELPLPPFYHAYGAAQRRLARIYNVALIPKHLFLSVIAEEDSTLDTIHLTQSGHQRMADAVWSVVAPAFDETQAQ